MNHDSFKAFFEIDYQLDLNFLKDVFFSNPHNLSCIFCLSHPKKLNHLFLHAKNLITSKCQCGHSRGCKGCGKTKYTQKPWFIESHNFLRMKWTIIYFIYASFINTITKRDMYINIRKSRVSSKNSWTIEPRAFDIFSSYCCNLRSSFQTSLCTLHPIQNCLVMTTQNILLHLRRSLYIHKKQNKIESIKMCIEANRQTIFRYKSNHYLIADWRYKRWSW